MKSFAQKPWMLPQPVLIIGTYNNDGTPNAISMRAHVTTENLNRCGESTIAQKR